jgi:catechol 2,3-dioxygenase-like lactoylglutathione lyase family enzyme
VVLRLRSAGRNGRFSPLAPKPEWRGSCEEATVIETEGLTHIHLLVSDLERSLRFYKGAFGLEEQFRDGPSMVFLRTPGSRDTITINADPARMDRVGRGGVDHFGFRLRPDVDLDAAITDVVAAGGRLVEQGEHAPGVPYAYVEDPDGYLIELGFVTANPERPIAGRRPDVNLRRLAPPWGPQPPHIRGSADEKPTGCRWSRGTTQFGAVRSRLVAV